MFETAHTRAIMTEGLWCIRALPLSRNKKNIFRRRNAEKEARKTLTVGSFAVMLF